MNKLNENFIDNNFINQLKKIIINANNKIIDIYENYDFNVQYKSDNSPLTIADQESNKIIIKGLININKTINMDIPIISEENKIVDFENRKKWKYCWLVDPLDGTKEFIKKNGEFTTNIGLIKNNSVIFGIVGIPVQKLIYYGGSNVKSIKVDYNNKFNEIKINKDYSKQFNIVASKSHLNQKTKDLIDNLKYENKNLVSYGSSLKILKVADGSADYYPRAAPTMEWDTCAAHGVLKGCNSNLLKIEDNTEIIYNKKDLLNPYFHTEL